MTNCIIFGINVIGQINIPKPLWGFFLVIIISLIFLLFCFWPSTFCLIYTLKENQFLSQLVPPLFKDIIIYVYQRKMLIEIVKLFP